VGMTSGNGDAVQGSSTGLGPGVRGSNTNPSGWAGIFNGRIAVVGGDAFKDGGGMWSANSDRRLKKDVADFRQGLAELEKVRPVTFGYNGLGDTHDDGKRFVGVIAQELEVVAPAMVGSTKMRLHPNDAATTDVKTVDPTAFTYMLINAVKEQQSTIQRLEARVASLESKAPKTLVAHPTRALGGLALGLFPLGFVALRLRRKR
jgi:hypothetical protein